MFINQDVIPKVQALLEPQDFYKEVHQYIAEAFFDLKAKADSVTVTNWLAEHGRKVPEGYITSLLDCVSTSAGWSHHVEIIKVLSERRKLIVACQEAMDRAYNLTEDFQNTLSEHKNAVRQIGISKKAGYRDNAELVNAVFKDIEERAQSGERFVGVKTGLANIDDHTHGLDPEIIAYLIARPSMGKTALALNVADYVALNYPGRVLFFSLESSDEALTRRRLAAHSSVYLSRLRTGDIEDSQWPSLIEAANALSEKSNLLLISDPKYKTIENLMALTESLAMDGPLSLVVVDHIQRMSAKKKTQNRHLELSYISEELTTLAQNLNVPMLILCQLKRAVEQRRNAKPKLSDMKESGDLEQNADMVWGLYRKSRDAEIAELECLKGRDIGTWTTWLRFDRFIQRFYDSEGQYEKPTIQEEEGFDL
jgi:replicative DNA helicase